ncbi:NrtR-regulated hypothetical OrfY [hydrothermal vent metagenome]|uniref:NrtR-regulated hypothetical OrfY n=1 Tax=hydrothermal vent metagenome TaxID=652676 RepID=A0A3B0Y0S7_9ZZZZ
MNKKVARKIILINRQSQLDSLLYRHNTVEQAQFYVENLGSDFDDYLLEDEQSKQALSSAEAILSQIGRVQLLEREFLPNFVFGKQDLIVVIGQDGLVANTLKYTSEQPVIAVNPDPDRYDGVLLPFAVEDLKRITHEVINQQRTVKEITMAKATLSDGQSLLAVNDFFIGPERHTSARYTLELEGISEIQSSSGIIISTGLGSTGWFKSIITGATSVAQSLGNTIAHSTLLSGHAWDSDSLFYTVREPFPSNKTGVTMVFGEFTTQSNFNMTSAMPKEGVIFSDGLLDDAVSFSSGVNVKITTAEEKGQLVI